MIETKLRKVESDHPNRCQATFRNGQCLYEAEENSELCHIHQRNNSNGTENKIRAYNLSKWKSTIDRFYNNPNIKTLREEIAIARMTLEAILDKCETPYDLLIHSNRIQILLMQIEKLVSSCNRLEDKLGFVLDRSSAILLAEQIVQISTLYVIPEHYEEFVQKIQDAVLVSGKEV